MSRATLQADSFLVADRADDWDLLRRYIDLGSEEAFSELVNRHLSWVHATCRKSLRDRQLAEDAAQAVFIIFARRAASIPPQARLSGWLFNTARFVVKDVLKQRARYRRREEIARELAAERLAPIARPAVDSDTQATLDDALATLTERDRQALLMHFYEGLSLAEMAEVLEISKEGVKKRVARALSRLRTRLGKNKKRNVASLVGVAMLLKSNAASALPLGLERSVVTAATVPGRATVVAQWMARQAMHAAAGASGRLLRAVLATELVGAVTAVGVWSLHSRSQPPAPAQASRITLTTSAPATVQPAPRVTVAIQKTSTPAPAAQTAAAEPPYHSGAFDPEPKIPELAHATAEVKKASPPAAPQPQETGGSGVLNSTYAGVPPVPRGTIPTAPPVPMPLKRSIPEAAGQVSVASAAPSAQPSALRPQTVSPAPAARPSAERDEQMVAQCIALVTPPDKLDPKTRPQHDTDELDHHDSRFGPMMHHRLGQPTKGSPVEVAMAPDAQQGYESSEERDWNAGAHFHHHLRRDLDDDPNSLTGRRPHHRPWSDFVDASNLPGNFDPTDNPCNPHPIHLPPNFGVDTETSFLAPGQFALAPEPGTLTLLAAALGTLTLRRRRRS